MEAMQLIGRGVQKQEVNGVSNLDAPKGRTMEKIAGYVGVSKNTLRKIVLSPSNFTQFTQAFFTKV